MKNVYWKGGWSDDRWGGRALLYGGGEGGGGLSLQEILIE